MKFLKKKTKTTKIKKLKELKRNLIKYTLTSQKPCGKI